MKALKYYLPQLTQIISRTMGLHFPKHRWYELESDLIHAFKKGGFKTLEDFVQMLLSPPWPSSLVRLLAECLLVGETYFFREKNTFRALQEEILPQLMKARQNSKYLRIWSAGCATGEEAYSLAIQLHRVIPDIKNWEISIIASDINPLFLQKAKNGIYGAWSFRDAPSWLEQQYFTKESESSLKIRPEFSENIQFIFLNLMDDNFPKDSRILNLDIIFCRNVLMYFKAEYIKKIIHKFSDCLVPEGWLFLSSSEHFASHSPYFDTVMISDTFVYKKKSKTKLATHSHKVENISPPQKPTLSVEKAPAESGDARFQRAHELFKKKQYEKALELASFMFHEDPERGANLLAKIYANQGDLEKALMWGKKALAANKINPKTYHLLATIYLERDQIDDAVLALKQAVFLDDHFIVAHFELGNLCLQRGDLRRSRRHWEHVLQILKNTPKGEYIPESDHLTAEKFEILVSHLLKGTYRDTGT